MLDNLRFVQGAVARKDFVPALTHFQIRGGRITGFNGVISLSSPIPLELDIRPKAAQLIKAIQTCQETIQLHVTPGGKLAVKSGKFKVMVDCTTEEFPGVAPDGVPVEFPTGLLAVFKKLYPFIADDASRPWARGILLRGSSAFATNNIVLVEHWLGGQVPTPINVPRVAVVELLRIGEEPESILVAENSVTFNFEGGRWLRTQTLSAEWPDLSRILDGQANLQPFPSELVEAVETIKPFSDALQAIFFTEAGVATTKTIDEDGAFVAFEGLPAGCFNAEMLIEVGGLATSIDFSAYPKPCLFQGAGVRGALVGMRL